MPRLTQETREAMAKIANKQVLLFAFLSFFRLHNSLPPTHNIYAAYTLPPQTEKARIHLRGIRHKVMDNVKKHKDKFSKDDVFKRGKEIDVLTHSMEEKCVKAVTAKKEDIMSV